MEEKSKFPINKQTTITSEKPVEKTLEPVQAEKKLAQAETVEDKILRAYNTSASSLQDLARIYNVPLDDVLRLTGNGNLASVQMGGDLIDAEEAGKAQLNYGEDVKVPFSLN